MKHLKKSSILRLTVEDNNELVVNEKYASYLRKIVESLLSGSPALDVVSQKIILDQVEKVFTDQDNELLLKAHAKDELFIIFKDINIHAFPGTDRLTW